MPRSEESPFSDAGEGLDVFADALGAGACWLLSAPREHPASEAPTSVIPTSVPATRAALCRIT
jgi:hypothetical protein